MPGERRASAFGTAAAVVVGVLLIAFYPYVGDAPMGPVPPVPSRIFKTPDASDRWRAGKVQALPCPVRPATNPLTLLKPGPISLPYGSYAKSELRLRSGGRIDLSDGLLGASRLDWVSAADRSGFTPEPRAESDELRHPNYTPVPRGYAVLTIAEIWDAGNPKAPQSGIDFGAAELRFSNTVPVRWEGHGYANTHIEAAAWFSRATHEHIAAAGAFVLDAIDDQGEPGLAVTDTWDTPCFYVDVAPRKIDQPHDVVLIRTHGDYGYSQYIGFDAAGRPSAAVMMGVADWSELRLPGTPPPGVS